MTFALVLLCTVAACFILRNPIHKCPMLFYAIAVALDVLFIFASSIGLPREIWLLMFPLLQKCILPTALFVVVMYIGVLKKGTKPYHWLKAIRAELSIIAWLLSLGHMVVYLIPYIPKVFGPAVLKTNVLASFIIAMVLFVLLILLGVTSFGFVKKHMKTKTWKNIQKWSYPFFGLVYVHILLMLLPSAMAGGRAALISVGTYSLVFIGYAILRLVRAYMDKRESV